VGTAIGLERHVAWAQSTSTSAAANTAATEAAARRAVSAINQALASGDMSVLDTAFAPDYVNHTPRRSPATGQFFSPDLAGLNASLTELRGTLVDAVILIEDIVASGDTAAVRATFRGTRDPAPAGADRVLRIGGAVFARFVNGLVAESWEYDEAAELYGPFPQPAAPPTEATEVPATEAPTGERRDVSGFDKVSLQGVGTMTIEQGDTESLTIDAEPKVLRRIESEVRNDTLVIRPDRSFNTSEPITYSLTVDDLTGIELSGAGQIQMRRLETTDLQLSGSGAGSIAIAELTAQTLQVEASGNTGIELGGTVDRQSVTLSGSAQYDAADLASRTATVSADGAAQAVVQVSDSLDASASGASRIAYTGDPEVSENTSGAGSVTRSG
jgi:ketosteroid isomerase-like protein